MSPLTSHPMPYQVELQLLPPNEERFLTDAQCKKLFGYEVNTVRGYAYRDMYWDTQNADLHGSSSMIRARHFAANSGDLDRTSFRGLTFERLPVSLEYKSTPSYMHQFFLARKYGFVRIATAEEFDDYISLRRPCEPLQMLYSDRPDLAGHNLRPDAFADVLVQLRRISGGQSEVQVDIAFHTYSLHVGAIEVERGDLIELQPNFISGNNLQRFLPHFKFVAQRFLDAGYELSPVGKYQRIPRKALDLLPNSKIYGVMVAP